MKNQYAIRIGIVCSVLLSLPSFGNADVPENKTSPAIAGHAWQPADAGCFSSSWSAVHNNCTTTKKFLVPLQIRYGGSGLSTVSLAAAAENDGTKTVGPSCRAVMNDADNGLIAQTPTKTIARGPAYVSVGVLPVGGAGFRGAAHVDCDLTSSSASGLGLTALKWLAQ